MEYTEDGVAKSFDPAPWKCSCIKTARRYGVPIPLQTNASDITVGDPPSVGGIVKFNYDGLYHVAVIVALYEHSFMVYEGNYNKCEESWRTIPFTDPNIVGFRTMR